MPDGHQRLKSARCADRGYDAAVGREPVRGVGDGDREEFRGNVAAHPAGWSGSAFPPPIEQGVQLGAVHRCEFGDAPQPESGRLQLANMGAHGFGVDVDDLPSAVGDHPFALLVVVR